MLSERWMFYELRMQAHGEHRTQNWTMNVRWTDSELTLNDRRNGNVERLRDWISWVVIYKSVWIRPSFIIVTCIENVPHNIKGTKRKKRCIFKYVNKASKFQDFRESNKMISITNLLILRRTNRNYFLEKINTIQIIGIHIERKQSWNTKSILFVANILLFVTLHASYLP